jgi:hypothetical protein
MSAFAWLSYSESERRKALDVISLFRERDTRDELGIGVIRDAFADLLFPGTSTIQTRARYFLFVPWVYQRLEKKRVRSAEIAERARRDELALIEHLAESDDPDGTIGIDARQTLKRLPSNVYWQGLERWGVRAYPGSQDQYHRSLDGFYARLGRALQNDDGEVVDDHARRNWHGGLPAPPEGFPDEASFHLTRAEAGYLRDRLLANASRTLLAFLAGEATPCDSVAFPWMHPQQDAFGPVIREQLFHARCFSEILHGAALLYNLMLARLRKAKDLISYYEDGVEGWVKSLDDAHARLGKWDRDRFWEIVLRAAPGAVPILTRQFVDEWLALALDGDVKRIDSNPKAANLIRARERTLKRGQARLENPRALELWGGAAGASQLDYRWRTVQTIVADIQRGLGA